MIHQLILRLTLLLTGSTALLVRRRRLTRRVGPEKDKPFGETERENGLETVAAGEGTTGFQDHPDRGDVPGWVLITLMTAGLVVALWAMAGEAFSTMFEDAMNKVRGVG